MNKDVLIKYLPYGTTQKELKQINNITHYVVQKQVI